MQDVGTKQERQTAAYAAARETFLRESHPKVHDRMKAMGRLKAHCREIGEEAAEMWQSIEGQMRTNPQAPEETKARMAYFQSIPLVADELVMAEVVNAAP